MLADRVLVLTDGVISLDHSIDSTFPRPRSRSDARFAALRSDLLAELGVEDDSNLDLSELEHELGVDLDLSDTTRPVPESRRPPDDQHALLHRPLVARRRARRHPALRAHRRRDPRPRPALAERRRGRSDPRRCGSSTRSCSSPASTSTPPSTSRSRRASVGPPRVTRSSPASTSTPRCSRSTTRRPPSWPRCTATSPSAAPGLSWHTDVTFVKRPPAGSILRAGHRPRRRRRHALLEPAGCVRGPQPVPAGLPVDAHRGARRRRTSSRRSSSWSARAPGKGRSSPASSRSSTRS